MSVTAEEKMRQLLESVEAKQRLRFITCGSVDDGKSTVIGRLLFDCKQIADDQIQNLLKDSVKHGTRGDQPDYALLVDGLSDEREQGITIDVAYRYFSTPKRSFIVADCPGHEQYTRNMATGASQADVAVVLVDARKGLLTQTRRHSFIVSLFGVRQIILAVNKMDLVNYSQSVFDSIAEQYRSLVKGFGVEHVECVPVCAIHGENLVSGSENMPWYQGPSLLSVLEQISVHTKAAPPSPRLLVQRINRPNSEFRGFSGALISGELNVGDAVCVQPSGRRSEITQILRGDTSVTAAANGTAVTVCLADEIDVVRGDVICSVDDPLKSSDQFAVHLLWMSDEALYPGRSYWLQLGTRRVPAQIMDISYRIDVNSQSHEAVKELHLNEVAVAKIHTAAAIAFDEFNRHAALGSFILIDRSSNATVACGTVDYSLRRAENVHWQDFTVEASSRAEQKFQTAKCLWFTGLSGSGKSTVANAVEKRLFAMGKHTYILDGDNVRHGLNKDLGFTDADRVENIRRVAEVARLMTDAGLIVLVSFISPFASERQMARELFAPGEFLEIFVDTPLAVCEQRDPKGLYAKARAGLIPNFTGIGSAYERPANPELHLHTQEQPVENLVEQVVERLIGNAG